MTGLHPLISQQLVDSTIAARRREAEEHRLATRLPRDGRTGRPWFVTLFVR